MRYRRNADSRLREMEREWIASGNLDLLIPINRERRRAGLSPHPDARVILANNALFEWVPRFAGQLESALQVFDEIDIPMYIGGLPEEGLREQVIALVNEIQQLETERRICSRAVTDINFGEDLDSEYSELLSRHGVSLIPLGGIQEIKEDEEEGEMSFHFFSLAQRQQQARSGHQENLELWGRIYQLVSRRALRIYRKLLAYGALPMNQVIDAVFDGVTLAESWFDSELNDLDELADKIEIATNEILDVTQGFSPSPEAIELFSNSWYKDED